MRERSPGREPLGDPLPRECKRVVLRRLQPADLQAFQAYRHDPQVGLYQGWEPQSDVDASRFIRGMSCIALFAPGQWVQLGIADRTNALIGDVGVCVAADERTAEIGFTLSAAAQGVGLGTEAVQETIALLFDHARVSEIIALTDTRNLPAVRLLERVGMRRRETVAAVFRGQPCFEHVYAISRTHEDETV
jgi:aminoglycoside 6'-N-acetyltransferase